MNGWIAMVTTICFLGSIHSNTLVTLQSGFVSLVDLDDDTVPSFVSLQTHSRLE